MELILTAKVIGAAEAKEIGLVSQVYAPEELMDKALELANAICANAPIAVSERVQALHPHGHADRHRHRLRLRG